jgi:hypothetical protein
MYKLKLKAQDVEVITFPEFVQYAKENSPEPHWSFMFRDKPVTHETDSWYLIPTKEGQTLNFTPNEVLVIRQDGTMFTLLSSDLHNAKE